MRSSDSDNAPQPTGRSAADRGCCGRQPLDSLGTGLPGDQSSRIWMRFSINGRCRAPEVHGACAWTVSGVTLAWADAALSLEDPMGLSTPDPDSSGESRLIYVGADPAGRVLVTVYALRARTVRIFSSRKASRAERRAYEAGT